MRNSPASTARPSYSPMTMGSSSSLDTCMEHSPFVGDRRRGAAAQDEKQQAARPDRDGPGTRDEERCTGADGADDDAAEHERPELGAVAGAVVGGEGATAKG